MPLTTYTLRPITCHVPARGFPPCHPTVGISIGNIVFLYSYLYYLSEREIFQRNSRNKLNFCIVYTSYMFPFFYSIKKNIVYMKIFYLLTPRKLYKNAWLLKGYAYHLFFMSNLRMGKNFRSAVCFADFRTNLSERNHLTIH